ncbi:phytanoyl-CoA dioxygenase [Burkholderia lata]|uniref:phytanoyl-CoA dioxygenase family protein n=1 Tax=Burkholderia lata (strain ATCC 17760 / DSM 23089 / LMG 22485 / NCIMB 9086 / R18194 / 383) TaxID=482957 RepID=UPI00145409EE|nr:phytanoyl-CoA dioxygenase family protein [Burkholderia lata]VWD14010.1 phytanoyl-CoA dioxygenase [Burkholderia lata]
MNATIQNIQDALPTVSKQTSAQEIVSLMNQYGGVRIKNYLTQEQVANINREVDAPLERLREGSSHENELIKEFHGTYTKRLTNMVTHSKTFGDVLDDELFHELGEVLYREESGDWWLSTAQVIDIGPGNTAQMLHRDVGNFPPLCALGVNGPTVFTNLMIALTRFTEENGATRIIPGSQNWDEDYFDSKGTPDMTIAAEMDAGDALLFSGKVIHGGGANVTKNERRRGLTIPMQPSYLTPEEAYPFIVEMDTVRRLSKRVQRIIGFRSQYPAGTPGLWQVDYDDIATHLGL